MERFTLDRFTLEWSYLMMGTLKYSNIFLLNRLANGYSLCMHTSSTSWDHCCAIVVWNDVARSPPLMANFHTQLIIVSPRVCKKGTLTPLAGRKMWWLSSENAAAHRATLGRVSNLVYIISELVCHLFATFCNQCLLCVCVCARRLPDCLLLASELTFLSRL